MKAIEYVRERWPFFDRSVAKKRPSHILVTHCEDNGLTLYDGTFDEFLKTRPGPLKPGEDWLDALPPTLSGTIFLTLFGLHFGQSRIQAWALDDHNRTDWRVARHRPPAPIFLTWACAGEAGAQKCARVA